MVDRCLGAHSTGFLTLWASGSFQSRTYDKLRTGEAEEMTILIEGKEYKVIENLGFQGGYYPKAVETGEGERIAVKRGGIWTWWRAKDRLQISGSKPEGRSG